MERLITIIYLFHLRIGSFQRMDFHILFFFAPASSPYLFALLYFNWELNFASLIIAKRKEAKRRVYLIPLKNKQLESWD